MTAVIGPLTRSDARPLAQVHREAFPGFFLSSLGERFLLQFYMGFLDDPTAVTVVARASDGSVLGAAVGTTEPQGYYRRLLRRRWPGFLGASALAVLRRPTAAPRLLRAARRPGDVPGETAGALLSSICVAPKAQGSGLGAELLTAWSQEASRLGASTAFLTTDAEGNDAVNRFYARHGWSLDDVHSTPEGRRMNRYTIRLGGH